MVAGVHDESVIAETRIVRISLGCGEIRRQHCGSSDRAICHAPSRRDLSVKIVDAEYLHMHERVFILFVKIGVLVAVGVALTAGVLVAGTGVVVGGTDVAVGTFWVIPAITVCATTVPRAASVAV